MSARRRSRLHDMTIDEVSLVDRAANQHANIAFSKAANQEDDMPEQMELFDEDGFPVDADSLEINDVVYDSEGNPGVIVPDDEYEDEQSEELEDEQEPELVGKGFNPVGAWRLGRQAGKGRFTARQLEGIDEAIGSGRSGRANRRIATMGANSVGNNAYRAAGGAALVGAGGAGAYGYKRKKDGAVEKSLGDVVLDELSKAASEDERSEIIAAALEEVEIAKAEAAQAIEYAQAAQDQQLEMAFISKAAEYNLPVAPEVLGPILKSASTVLSAEELDVLDQLFSGIGEYLFNEIGVVGDTDNDDVYSQVDNAARELVGKADGSLSPEQAMTMMFENNPAAYEQYLAENGR